MAQNLVRLKKKILTERGLLKRLRILDETCFLQEVGESCSQFSLSPPWTRTLFMYDHLSFVRRVSQLGTILFTRLTGVRVGEDESGNHYYRSRVTNRNGDEKRWVIYAAEPEASLVPPTWYGWLHHTCDQPLPSDPENRYGWQKPHQPNLSGTEVAPFPIGHPLHEIVHGACLRDKGSCQSWNPPE